LHQSNSLSLAALSPLADKGWLATQPAAFQSWIASAGRWRTYEAHQMLYQAGSEPEGLYGLGSGAWELTLPLIGGEPVVFHRAEPGSWIGDSAILAETRRHISVAAAVTSRVFCVPTLAIRAALASRPEFWPCFFALNHYNSSQAVTLLAEVLSLSPRARLARMLLRLADKQGFMNVTHTDLARLIGMNRSSLQRSLNSLIEAGLISTSYRTLTVLDWAGLEALINEA
jgi:CRP/FNR family cyclic AMP-dependent transcriptional regulator